MKASTLDLAKMVKQWECLPGFPRTDEGRDALLDQFKTITGGEPEHASWLSKRVLQGCSRCPTPLEMRRIFEQKHPPADGLESNRIDMSDYMTKSGKASE